MYLLLICCSVSHLVHHWIVIGCSLVLSEAVSLPACGPRTSSPRGSVCGSIFGLLVLAFGFWDWCSVGCGMSAQLPVSSNAPVPEQMPASLLGGNQAFLLYDYVLHSWHPCYITQSLHCSMMPICLVWHKATIVLYCWVLCSIACVQLCHALCSCLFGTLNTSLADVILPLPCVPLHICRALYASYLFALLPCLVLH